MQLLTGQKFIHSTPILAKLALNHTVGCCTILTLCNQLNFCEFQQLIQINFSENLYIFRVHRAATKWQEVWQTKV